MDNPFAAPEISPEELQVWLQDANPPVMLDCREPNEWEIARLDGAHLVPLSVLAQQGLYALPPEITPDREVVVYCHHGVRSAQVVAWLQQQGYSQVRNLAGGIDAWAGRIDPALARY